MDACEIFEQHMAGISNAVICTNTYWNTTRDGTPLHRRISFLLKHRTELARVSANVRAWYVIPALCPLPLSRLSLPLVLFLPLLCRCVSLELKRAVRRYAAYKRNLATKLRTAFDNLVDRAAKS